MCATTRRGRAMTLLDCENHPDRLVGISWLTNCRRKQEVSKVALRFVSLAHSIPRPCIASRFVLRRSCAARDATSVRHVSEKKLPSSSAAHAPFPRIDRGFHRRVRSAFAIARFEGDGHVRAPRARRGVRWRPKAIQSDGQREARGRQPFGKERIRTREETGQRWRRKSRPFRDRRRRASDGDEREREECEDGYDEWNRCRRTSWRERWKPSIPEDAEEECSIDGDGREPEGWRRSNGSESEAANTWNETDGRRRSRKFRCSNDMHTRGANCAYANSMAIVAVLC